MNNIDKLAKAFKVCISKDNIRNIKDLEEEARRRINSFLVKGFILDIKPITFMEKIDSFSLKYRYGTFFTLYFGMVLNEYKFLSEQKKDMNLSHKTLLELSYLKVRLSKGL